MRMLEGSITSVIASEAKQSLYNCIASPPRRIAMTVLFLLFLSSKIIAQPTTFIDTPSKIVMVDGFRRIWLVHPDNAISQYDSNGKIITTQKMYNYGKVTSVDSRDPMQISIFYANQGRIIYTDKNLNSILKINLFEGATSFQASAFCQSNDGNFWIFDMSDFRLKKLNFQKQVLLNSQSVRETGAKKITITKIMEQPPYLYVMINKTGLAVYDIYGGFIKLIREPNIRHFYPQSNESVVILSDTKLVEYNVSKNVQTDVTLQVQYNTVDYVYPFKDGWLMGNSERSYLIKK